MHGAAILLGSLAGQIDPMILAHHYSNFHQYSDLVTRPYTSTSASKLPLQQQNACHELDLATVRITPCDFWLCYGSFQAVHNFSKPAARLEHLCKDFLRPFSFAMSFPTSE